MQNFKILVEYEEKNVIWRNDVNDNNVSDIDDAENSNDVDNSNDSDDSNGNNDVNDVNDVSDVNESVKIDDIFGSSPETTENRSRYNHLLRNSLPRNKDLGRVLNSLKHKHARERFFTSEEFGPRDQCY